MPETKQLYIAPKTIEMPHTPNGLAIIFKQFNDEKSNQISIAMLKRIIEGGLKLNFSDTLVVQLKDKEVIKLPKNIQNIFLFGINPKRISLNINQIHNKIIKIDYQSIIFTDDTLVMQNDDGKKRAFWNEVTKIYNV